MDHPTPEDGDPLGQGQGSAADAGLEQDDTMRQERLQAEHSTSAQRSGGQEEGGAGSDASSFAGSSLGGQSS